MRICLISVEIFAWGKYGGFGRATRTIGGHLARLGHEVYAVVPRRAGQRPVEKLDGITVLGFSPARPWEAVACLRRADAQIYHSCEPSWISFQARRHLPRRRHMITCRDPRNHHDWWLEFRDPSLNRAQVLHNYLFEHNPFVWHTVKNADAVYTIANDLVAKVKAMYRPRVEPRFLPTPVAIPHRIAKADRPTVCYMARLDRRKRPELALELARQFPDVDFIIAGKSRDKAWEERLHARFGHLPNVTMTGHVDQFSSSLHGEILGKGWIMINTATREALPNSFLEAAAHGCAILSAVNPDGFASRFGYHAGRDDFARGLEYLLQNDRWREKGMAGRRYVSDVFATERAMARHLEAYNALLAEK